MWGESSDARSSFIHSNCNSVLSTPWNLCSVLTTCHRLCWSLGYSFFPTWHYCRVHRNFLLAVVHPRFLCCWKRDLSTVESTTGPRYCWVVPFCSKPNVCECFTGGARVGNILFVSNASPVRCYPIFCISYQCCQIWRAATSESIWDVMGSLSEKRFEMVTKKSWLGKIRRNSGFVRARGTSYLVLFLVDMISEKARVVNQMRTRTDKPARVHSRNWGNNERKKRPAHTNWLFLVIVKWRSCCAVRVVLFSLIRTEQSAADTPIKNAMSIP